MTNKHTPPTNAEVEEILEKHHLSVMEETIANANGQSNTETTDNLNKAYKDATQAITHLIQQAELRGRIDELERLVGETSTGEKYRLKSRYEFMTTDQRIENLKRLQEEDEH